ncbi:hypothetical protein [Paenibacillus sp. DRB1-1]|uniref:hypothetical protein n=1 Tax=Paenibacillus sp. DRB1-1 TaxID=3422309 RepID=UPI003F995B0D
MAVDREIKFGRVLAIANVLGEKVKDKGEIGISPKHMERYGFKPATTLERIHKDLMQHAEKFGEEEMILFDLLMEEMAQIDWDEFTDEPLRGRYLQAYGAQQHTLDNVMGAVEAAKEWDYDSPGTVKNLCATGKVIAKKIGNTWVIDKNQPNPKLARNSDGE